MERKELICIGCPMGCPVTVEMNGENVVSVTGNTCPRGERYARKEVTDPTRIVTSTVKVRGGDRAACACEDKRGYSEREIFECMKALTGVEVSAPIGIGDVIISDVAGTGVDIVATKEVRSVGKAD